MIPQPKVNRHVFNLIIARGLEADKVDTMAFDIVKTQEKISDLNNKLIEMQEKRTRYLEKIEALDRTMLDIAKKISEKEAEIKQTQEAIRESGITPIQYVTS